jgi:hypothetical protein
MALPMMEPSLDAPYETVFHALAESFGGDINHVSLPSTLAVFESSGGSSMSTSERQIQREFTRRLVESRTDSLYLAVVLSCFSNTFTENLEGVRCLAQTLMLNEPGLAIRPRYTRTAIMRWAKLNTSDHTNTLKFWASHYQCSPSTLKRDKRKIFDCLATYRDWALKDIENLLIDEGHVRWRCL